MEQQKFDFERDRLYYIDRHDNLLYLGDSNQEHKFVQFEVPPREITTDEERRVIDVKFRSFKIHGELLYPLRADYLIEEKRRLSSLEIVRYNEACREIMEIYEQSKRARGN